MSCLFSKSAGVSQIPYPTLNGNFSSLVRFSNHGAPTWLTLVLCYPYLLLELILKLLFEKIELTNVPDVDSRAKKKGFGVDGERAGL